MHEQVRVQLLVAWTTIKMQSNLYHPVSGNREPMRMRRQTKRPTGDSQGKNGWF